MPHFPKPFFRTSRRQWYVQIAGKQHPLGPDESAAFQKYHRLMAEAGVPVAAAPVAVSATVVEILDRFLEWAEKNRAPRTYDSYKERLQSFIDHLKAESLLHLAAGELRPHHIWAWVDKHENWAPGMKRGRIGAVQRAFSHSLEDGFIERNPIAKIRKPSQGRRENPISEEDFKAIVKKAQIEGFRNLLVAAWETGARPQELIRVAVENVDLQNRRWVFQVKGSKGKRKVRVVYLTDKAFEITKKLVERYRTGPLFRNRYGEPWTANSIGCAFQRFEKSTGKRYALVDFRHTFATRALKAGIGVVTVANLMGHANANMIASVYQHLDQDQAHLEETFRRIG